MPKHQRIREFGDFQTPVEFAREICLLLSAQGFTPASVVEPTCGKGNFILAALEVFPTISKAVGVEINPQYVSVAKSVLGESHSNRDVKI